MAPSRLQGIVFQYIGILKLPIDFNTTISFKMFYIDKKQEESWSWSLTIYTTHVVVLILLFFCQKIRR